VAIILGNGSGLQIYLNGPHQAKNPLTGKTAPINVRKRILYVGEEPQAVEMERNLLEDLGYRVTALTSSLRAWEVFCSRSQEFDLVITDLNIPQLTGVELATELVKMRPDLPIIICLGINESVSPELTRKLNIRGVLMKPARITDFVRAIRRALDSGRE
jgi:CheY-like chemotaxis protein